VNGTARALLLAAVQLALVLAVGAKLQYDRSTLPRAWVEAAGVDPNLPIRGRYVALNLLFEPAPGTAVTAEEHRPMPGRLVMRDGQPVVATLPEARGTWRWNVQSFVGTDTSHGRRWRTVEAVAFFLPEHAPDPTRDVQPGELWVEVTIPRAGAPRPIRLGLLRDGRIEPIR